MSRSWSSAHDWKSCKGQKLFESSNLSISAKIKACLLAGFYFYPRDGEIRINIEHPGGVFICQCEHWQIPLFFLWKNANGYSPSPPKRTVHLPVGCSFSMRDGEIRIQIEHPSGVFICQCEHWQIPLFFLWKNANGYSPSPPEKSTCKSKCFFQRNKSLSGFVKCGA